MRATLALIHRYVGLVIALFLMLAGLTGALIVWEAELEGLLHPYMMRVAPPSTEATPLDPLILLETVERHYSNARVVVAQLEPTPGRSLIYWLEAKDGMEPLPNDQVFVNPYTGMILGERLWGDLRQGSRNLIPFVYRLHYSLVLGDAGTWLMGIVAVVWALTCFLGMALSIPARFGTGFWSRWRPFWKVRWRAGATATTYDLHRAGGLWLWMVLLVLAWSAVAFNLPQLYRPVMQPFFSTQPQLEHLPPLSAPSTDASVSWQQARVIGRRLAAEAAAQHHFDLSSEQWLIYMREMGVYRYRVLSSLDVGEKLGRTDLLIDAFTGEAKGLWLPTGRAAGDTIHTWITHLHMAAVGGLPFRLFMCLIGLGVAILSATGVMMWWRRRGRARKKSGRIPAVGENSASAVPADPRFGGLRSRSGT